MGGPEITKDAGIHVTCKHHSGCIPSDESSGAFRNKRYDKQVAEGLAKECQCNSRRKTELAWLRRGESEFLAVRIGEDQCD